LNAYKLVQREYPFDLSLFVSIYHHQKGVQDMQAANTTISEVFMESLRNAYGSRHNFEKELVYRAYQYGNKGRLYFGINKLLNFTMYPACLKEENHASIPLLECNLDVCDIANFIEDIDYTKLSKAYLQVRSLIQS